jgi:apolipoprotein N-acyltransferase
MAGAAAGFAEVFRQENWKKRGAMLVVALTPVLGTASYGLWRLHQPESGPSQLKVALVQGSVDVVFPPPPGTNEKMHQQYWELSLATVRHGNSLDLIIWPETVYGEFLIDGTPDALPPPQWAGSVAEFHHALKQAVQASREHLYTSAQILGMPMIVGINRQEWTAEGPKIYNSAVLVPLMEKQVALSQKYDNDPFEVSGQDQSKRGSSISNNPSAKDPHLGEAGRENSPLANAPSFTPPIEVYDKLHLVMFGEYIPFARYFEGLIQLTPLSTLQVNTEPGQKPKCFVVGEAQLVPNICFESTVPHLIRRQLRELRKAGFVPNALVNLTNDGWFWGSAALDLHLACSVFRAVEFRKPHLIAANTGISAWVDSIGRIRAEAPRRTLQVLLADVTLDDQVTMYLVLGDWLGILCLGFVLVVLCIEFLEKLRTQKQKDVPNST